MYPSHADVKDNRESLLLGPEKQFLKLLFAGDSKFNTVRRVVLRASRSMHMLV